MKVYIASDIRHARNWIAIRPNVYPHLTIVSSWLDFLKDGEPPNLTENTIKQSWDNNLVDIHLCDVLILFVEKGDSMRGSCFEAGVAFAIGKRIIYVGEPETIGSVGCCFERFSSLGLVIQVLMDEEAMKRNARFVGNETRQ